MSNNNILQYESTVWQTADLLIGAGIKQSDFPKYMMPFFALVMVESRLLRESKSLLEEYGVEKITDLVEEDRESFVEEFADNGLGYNEMIIREGTTLVDICANDKTFDIDFDKYLKAFDLQTKSLLGVDKGNEEEKFMNISGICGLLKKKNILFATAKAWSEIDLQPFDNSEITTLEEHIKRRWADISAETAGEQYTPNDIIALIAEIILSKIDDDGTFLTIYDPTCGGGNLLFGVEDRISETYSRPVKTFGEDWNDTLYALAKIESRFRNDSEIEYGNSLTGLKFSDKQFNVVVANPPYGVDWKGYKKEIEIDQTERFVDLPAVSDGQFLFTQHILSQLDEEGLSVVVHNGSTLFSGDAGGGESNIRKHFFDNDYVEAIIQLPTDEFFNTGIYTYLWVFNKNKAADRKDKVMLINGSQFFAPLKKSRGKKRKEMVQANRDAIVNSLANFKDTDFAKVFDKWHFYYNKQAIVLTNVDESGLTYEDQLEIKTNRNGDEVSVKSTKLSPVKIRQVDDEGEVIELSQFTITKFDKTLYPSLKEYNNQYIKPLLAGFEYKEYDLRVETAEATYFYNAEKETLVKEKSGIQTELGCGKIVIKTSYKTSKTNGDQIVITAELVPDYQKDYEIIPYSPIEKHNKALISQFMQKYITKPFEYLEQVVGVEINFNKEFYKPEELREVSEISKELGELDKELITLERELKL